MDREAQLLEERAQQIALYQKIFEIVKTIEYMTKDTRIEFGTTKYKAVSEEKVTMKVRKELVKHKLIVLQRCVSIDHEGKLTTVKCEYDLIDTETGYSVPLESVGQGSDSQDKGSSKALTNSWKYLLLRMFMIPTGEDPDKIASAEMDEDYKYDQQHEELVSRIMEIYKELNVTPAQAVATNQEILHTTKYKDASIDNLELLVKHLSGQLDKKNAGGSE